MHADLAGMLSLVSIGEDQGFERRLAAAISAPEGARFASDRGRDGDNVGPPGAPRITVNPVSAMAPGLLRKFVPSPGTFDPKFTPSPGAYDQNFIPPSR